MIMNKNFLNKAILCAINNLERVDRLSLYVVEEGLGITAEDGWKRIDKYFVPFETEDGTIVITEEDDDVDYNQGLIFDISIP